MLYSQIVAVRSRIGQCLPCIMVFMQVPLSIIRDDSADVTNKTSTVSVTI